MEHRRYKYILISSLIAILLVSFLRTFPPLEGGQPFFRAMAAFTVVLLYATLIILWGISMARHIMQDRIRRSMMMIALLLLLWILIQDMRWRFVDGGVLSRLLWYAYYVPMLIIPYLGFYSALCISKPEDYVPPLRYRLLFTVGIALIVMVLTNDFHQFVFRIPDFSDSDHYSYGVGYYLCVLWNMVLELSMLIIMIRRFHHQIQGRERIRLGLVVAVGAVYVILSQSPLFSYVEKFVDVLTMYGWVSVMLWETCVDLGLVPVNFHHTDFFLNSSIHAQIVNRNGVPYVKAREALTLDRGRFEELLSRGTKLYNESIELHLYDVTPGYVIWQQDVRSINSTIEQLRQIGQEMQERSTLEQEEYRVAIRRSRIEAQNRIYEALADETKEGLRRMKQYAIAMEKIEDTHEAFHLLAKMNVLAVYLKRKSNFIMITQNRPTIPPEELALCMMEIQRNVGICHLEFLYEVNLERELYRAEVLAAYDSLELYLEDILYTARSLLVSFEDEEQGMTMYLDMPGAEQVRIPFEKGGAL